MHGLLNDSIINIREMTLIDDASGRQLLVPLEVFRVVQPPNWDEMISDDNGRWLFRQIPEEPWGELG